MPSESSKNRFFFKQKKKKMKYLIDESEKTNPHIPSLFLMDREQLQKYKNHKLEDIDTK
jgi:hypothetical protein